MQKDGSITPEPNGQSTIPIGGLFCTGLWHCSLTHFVSCLTNGYMNQSECHHTRVHLGLMQEHLAELLKTTRHRLTNLLQKLKSLSTSHGQQHWNVKGERMNIRHMWSFSVITSDMLFSEELRE